MRQWLRRRRRFQLLGCSLLVLSLRIALPTDCTADNSNESRYFDDYYIPIERPFLWLAHHEYVKYDDDETGE